MTDPAEVMMEPGDRVTLVASSPRSAFAVRLPVTLIALSQLALYTAPDISKPHPAGRVVTVGAELQVIEVRGNWLCVWRSPSGSGWVEYWVYCALNFVILAGAPPSLA